MLIPPLHPVPVNAAALSCTALLPVFQAPEIKLQLLHQGVHGLVILDGVLVTPRLPLVLIVYLPHHTVLQRFPPMRCPILNAPILHRYEPQTRKPTGKLRYSVHRFRRLRDQRNAFVSFFAA